MLKRVLLLVAACVCLTADVAHAQRRKVSKPPGRPAVKTVCVGEKLPAGYVAVAVVESATCRQGAWSLKRPGDVETVCEGSQLPEDYEVKEITGAAQCGGMNPVSNAMLIARAGVPYARPAGERRAGSGSVGGVRQAEVDAILDARAAEINRAAELSNAAARREAELSSAVSRNEIAPGMTMEQVLESWGRPHDSSAVTKSGAGTRERWTYMSGGEFVDIHFKDGVVERWTWYH